MLRGQPSKRGKMNQSERFLEYPVCQEEAVDFCQDSDSAEGGENKEVVRRLRAKIAAVMTDSSTSQEETEGSDRSQTNVERCEEHPEETLEYWCEEDCSEVCKDCLIFGDHRGHRAVKGEQRRLAIMVDKFGKTLPSLERELGRAEGTGKIIAAQGKELFNKVKEEVIELLDAKYEVESSRMLSLISAHCSSLEKAITIIHSFQAGLSSSKHPLLDEEVTRLVSHPLQLHMTPGTVAWHDGVLSITPPLLAVTNDTNPCTSIITTTQVSISSLTTNQASTSCLTTNQANTRSLTTTQASTSSLTIAPACASSHTTATQASTSSLITTQASPSMLTTTLANASILNTTQKASPSSLTTTQTSHLIDRSPSGYRRSEKIISIDIMTVDGDIVKVKENGTPAQFYCRPLSSDPQMEEMEKMLLDVEVEKVYPSAGQGVLVRLEGRWVRAVLLGCNNQGWMCELVDIGQVVKNVKEVDMSNLPLNVVEIPAMAVRCSLAGWEHNNRWTKEAKFNWEKIVHEQQFTMAVVDPGLNVVHLTRQNVSLLDSLVFLGHIPDIPHPTLPTQQFSLPGHLSKAATLCCDYDQISPNSLLLYFDNPLHVAHLEQLSQLDHHPALVSPPGLVQHGSAVLAPWEGELFRATVLAVTGTSLTVLYVDHGNTDTVSWWDCYAVPEDLLFPPLATQVRLGGVRPVREAGWEGEERGRLHQVLNDSEGILVKIVESEAGSVPEVMLMVRRGNDLQDVGELLVKEGFAQWEEENWDQLHTNNNILGLSQRSSNSSSGTMMSNFLGREDTLDHLDNKNLMTEVKNVSSSKMAEITKHSVTAPLHRQPSSNVFPLLPSKQVFTAMLTHIDSSAVVWVIPRTVINIFSEVIAELGNCLGPVQDVSPGMMVVARISGRKVRGRVLEEGSVVKLIDVDSGEVFSSPRENLAEVSPSLLCKPPLAIPLKLYGVRKCCTGLGDDETGAVFEKIGKKTSTPFWCTVSVLEKNLDQFPLPTHVRYTVLEEHDGNLALDLMKMGICEVITSFSQWEREVSDHCLDWMLDPMSVPTTLSFVPHPLPLAVGQWLHVSVEGLEYPLDERGLEEDPVLTTPDANRIGVQIKYLSSKSAFDKHQEDIAQSLAVVAPQVLKLNNLAGEAKLSLALSARTAEKVASPTVGQSVLVFYEYSGEGEGGEWCRGTVETIQRGGRVTIHYIDFGHRGQVEVGQLRSMRYKERMMPVQLREVKFHLPDSNQELEAIRLDLREEEKMMMRVEAITPLGYPMELEEILVSVWRAVGGEEEESFLLNKIC